MMKKISILGCTGSIGTQTLDIVRQNKELKVVALAARSNIELLERQVREFKPRLVCVYDESKALAFCDNVKDLNVNVVTGMDGLIASASYDEAQTVVTALVGMIGILPTIEAIKSGKNIALANKETLVTAGHLIMPLVKEKNVSLLPVDSEHSAILQCLNGEDKRSVNKIILTASGGPFRGRQIKELENVCAKDALKHPNWDMGHKITIDSATMVNKGLEVMEAAWLFGIGIDRIQVVIHPQSIIHSMVEYVDGSIIAQMGIPDMRIPIQYSLFYPNRKIISHSEKVDFIKLGNLIFEEPDMDTFIGLRLGYEAARVGGSMPTVYNAANEWAVARFLDNKIGFNDIPMLIDKAMMHHKVIKEPTLNDILNAESETYDFISE